MRRLLLNETNVSVKDRLIPILEYDGLPVTARKIAGMIRNFITLGNVTPITRRASAQEVSA
jgi:2-oxoglutarate ferredoxin oxidoreductase subunit alpha